MSHTAPGAPLLTIDALHARFNSPTGMVRAVNGVSLTVPSQRRLGVVGESGSGKTQTFFGIFGLAAGAPGVVAGRAHFAGTDLLEGLDRFLKPAGVPTPGDREGSVTKDAAGFARHQQALLTPLLGSEVAVLFQDPKRSLIPYWTIGQHLNDVLARRSAGTSETAEQLLSSLGFRDPSRILNSYPEQLSGGEAQRALLAITMAMRPQLLVADEPTTGLDTINQARVLDALLEVQSRASLALVLISHDLAVVDAMVDDIVVLFAGRVMERATADGLRRASNDEIHPYTLQLRDSQRRRANGSGIDLAAHTHKLARAATGCPYHARCELRPKLSAALQKKCSTDVPGEVAVGDQHALACWGIGR